MCENVTWRFFETMTASRGSPSNVTPSPQPHATRFDDLPTPTCSSMPARSSSARCSTSSAPPHLPVEIRRGPGRAGDERRPAHVHRGDLPARHLRPRLAAPRSDLPRYTRSRRRPHRRGDHRPHRLSDREALRLARIISTAGVPSARLTTSMARAFFHSSGVPGHAAPAARPASGRSPSHACDWPKHL